MMMVMVMIVVVVIVTVKIDLVLLLLLLEIDKKDRKNGHFQSVCGLLLAIVARERNRRTCP